MTEPTTPAAPAQESTTPAPVTPPWGSDENFDPNRAWSLIENLRAEKEKLAARPTVTAEQQKQLEEYSRLVEASKSEKERLAEAAEQAKRDAEVARAEATRYKVAATHGISAEHFDLLGSGSEEEISARAEKLAALLAAQANIAAPTATPQTRPVEQLRPGATPSQADNEEDVIFASLFGTKQ